VGKNITWSALLRGLAAWPLLALLLGTCGCSRPKAAPTHPGTAQSQQHQAPFREADETNPDLTASLSPAVHHSEPRGLQSSLPFADVPSLPAGTLLTVRLKTSVYASTSPAEASFEAVVVEPVIVEGNTLIPNGASVAGRVESARTSTLKPNRGYVRLALHSVQMGDRQLPVQTASLFAREAPLGDDPISVIHLEKGRRLTFRLSQATYSSSLPPEVAP